jgi:hypothetical protein
MPESDKEKPKSSEVQQGTEFERFKALASSLLKVRKEEVDDVKRDADPKQNEGRNE